MNINKKNLLMIINLLFIVLFLNGCWDSKDINEKTVVTAAIIDNINDEIIIYVEIANIEASETGENKSGNTVKKYIYLKGHGNTVIEARDNLNNQLHKPLYLSAIRTIFFTENFAKTNDLLIEYLYRLRQDQTYRKKTISVITDAEPENLLNIINEQDFSIGFETEHILSALKEEGASFLPTTTSLLENLSNDYSSFLIPCMGLQDKNIILKGYSVFNDTKITDFIPVENSQDIVFLKADKAKYNYTVSYNDVDYTIQTTLKKRDIKPKYENGKISFDVKFDMKATILYGNKKIPYNIEDSDIAKISEKLKEILKKELMSAIEQSQIIFKCDYFQFDDAFRIKYPNDFKKMDWAAEYLKANFQVDVNIDLKVDAMMNYKNNRLN